VTSSLFSPITLRALEVPDRLWVSPMCQYSATDGIVGQWHAVHLGGFSTGSASVIISEATAVSPEGRITPGDAGIWSDAQEAAWAPIVSFVHEQGSAIAIQLAHAGRKASARIPWHQGPSAVAPEQGGWQPLAPSPVAFGDLTTPAEMTLQDISQLVTDFAEAAKRSVRAGFDAIEIHAAHGYLLHEFLSPLSNRRSDAYGGDFGSRARVVVDIVDAVRAVVPESLPVFVRISATDWIDGGWDIDESVQLSALLAGHGVDLMDVSSGGLDLGQKITPGPGYQVPFATRIKNEAGIAVAAVGQITTARQAEDIVAQGNADVVLAARAFLREPSFSRRIAVELGVVPRWPNQYLRARNDGQ
jgi:2,4-dienoyl-CoA reductase-like NADH-dependent reductase (Old Yellow Enzyme family)